MDVNYSKEDMNFREEAQHFFAQELPGELKEKLEKGSPIYKEDQILWQKTLAKKGWAGINWPVEYGGTGWTVTQKAIFAEEQAKHDAPRLVPFGLELVAPVIIAFGNDAQKKTVFCRISWKATSGGARAIPNQGRDRIWRP